MIRLGGVIVMMLFYFFASAQEKPGAVVVEITNIQNLKGKVLLVLNNSEGSWLKKPCQGAFGRIENGASTVRFLDVSDGVNAISVFHDQDNDGELDTFLGISTADTGWPNNTPARFGSPEWSAAKFEVLGISIKKELKI